MARHLNRAALQAPDGRHLLYITIAQAYELVEGGDAIRLTGNRDLRQGKPLVIRLNSAKDTYRVIATLTRGDMERNAEAVAAGKRNFASSKVEAWPHEHDTFAVTVCAGMVFIPDAKAAAARAASMAGQHA